MTITLPLVNLDTHAAQVLGSLWLHGHLGNIDTFDACLLAALERGLALVEFALIEDRADLTHALAHSEPRGADLPDHVLGARATLVKRLDSARVRCAIAHNAPVLPRPLFACLLVELGARSLAHDAEGLAPTALDLCPEEEP